MADTITSQGDRNVATPQSQHADEMQPCQDFMTYLKMYAREKPDVAAIWCFGLGFVIGWKLKPW